ncbi:UTRA domain-containing protein [Rhodospirillaceae bacterium KN72]|uniref:UTRA domain-containing protein n=1 Tax=Pacificispira spongiicola TaxID=2729598 RepID=A0A7Y0HER3_9PROT|nr:UTRA domain-containing protein [Pacificispira spongiicola]NMM43177.1 UTRA domain-containing protein [Pacificispira spongiicola]
MRELAPYLRIKEDLLDRVRSGTWKPGDLIPGEQRLAEQFGCARATVHRALRELAEEGVLERRRKAGTRVARPTSRSVAFDIPLVEDEIRATGARYHYELLEREIAPLPPAEAASLERATGTPALHLRCLHFADRRPYQLEDRWIDIDTVPEAVDVDFAAEGANGWLVHNVPWTDAEHSIHADLAAGEIARSLNLTDGDPVLVVERRTWNDKGPVTTVRFHHPGRSHRLRTAFVAR